MRDRVPVSERALAQRISRKLKPKGEVLTKARGAKAEQELGKYFIVDLQTNVVVEKDVDIQQKARELQALAEWEELTTQ